MPEIKDITGRVFGRLTPRRVVGRMPDRKAAWECDCTCGGKVITTSVKLKSGHTSSCGCHRREVLKRGPKVSFKHGMAYHPVGNSFYAMLKRCYDPKTKGYENWGGRGIRVCEFLRATPRNLLELLGPRPAGLTLERIRNEESYQCGRCSECLRLGLSLNVEWATRKTQARNTRRNHYIEYNGETRCLSEWAELKGVDTKTIMLRIADGKDPFKWRCTRKDPKCQQSH